MSVEEKKPKSEIIPILLIIASVIFLFATFINPNLNIPERMEAPIIIECYDVYDDKELLNFTVEFIKYGDIEIAYHTTTGSIETIKRYKEATMVMFRITVEGYQPLLVRYNLGYLPQVGVDIRYYINVPMWVIE